MPRVNLKCDNCGKIFSIPAFQRRGKHKYCSRRCAHIGRIEVINKTKKQIYGNRK